MFSLPYLARLVLVFGGAFLCLVLLRKIAPKRMGEPVWAWALLAFVAAFPLEQLIELFSYQWVALQAWDTPIYWAVGRGWLNGIPFYTGLFDIKPPGIFLAAALSFSLFDGLCLMHLLQTLSHIWIALMPVLAYLLYSKIFSLFRFGLFFSFGILLSYYTASHALPLQVESFGAGFACLYVFVLLSPSFEKNKWLWTSLATLGLLGACGFKEPFLFPLFGVSLLFCENLKDWRQRFVVPLVFAVGIGFALLCILGIWDGFLFYLEHMLGAHVERYGNPFLRGLPFWTLIQDSHWFGLLCLVLSIVPLVACWGESSLAKIFFALLAGWLLSSFTVRLGGESYVHHYVFAVPFYMGLCIFASRFLRKGALSIILCLSFAIACVKISVPVPWSDYAAHSLQTQQQPAMEAAYMDSVLDKAGIERYMYLGVHDMAPIKFYGWTRHSPQGPYFFQPWKLVTIPGFVDSTLAAVKRSDVVCVTPYTFLPDTTKKVIDSILVADFTSIPWPEVADIPRPNLSFYLLFRKERVKL